MKKQRIAVLLMLIFITGIFSACKSKNSEEKSDAKEAVTVIVSSPMKLEEADTICTSAHDFIPFELVYEPLVRYGYDGKIEPGLAEKWEISEDGKTYTFHLRKDVKFSDGTEFNADNVIFNTDRWSESKSFSSELNEVKKIDDYTVSFTFEDAAYPCLIEFTYPRPYRMLAPSALDKDGNFKQMVGTGPWMVEDYKSGKEATFVPNPNYYGEKPSVEKLIFRHVTDGQAKTMALQSGDADICLTDLPVESMEVVEKEKDLAIIEAPGTLGFYAIFNEKNEFLQDMNVRQALNYGLDKETVCENLLDGQGTPAEGLLPPVTPYVTKTNSSGYAYDPEKAKELLKEAGFEDSNNDGIVEKDGKDLSLELVFQTEEYGTWKALCEFLQSEYRKIGVDIKLNQKEVTGYYDSIWKTRDFDMILYRTYEDSWNPHGFLTSMFKMQDGEDAVTWSDENLSDNCSEVMKTLDEEKRVELYDKIFKQINDEALTLPIYYPKKNYVYNQSRISDVEYASTSYEAINWNKIKLK